MSSRAGRRRSAVWACFIENHSSGKRRVLCRFCQHDIVANPIRMVRHIMNHCPSADDAHKQICREYQTLTIPSRRHVGSHDDSSADSHLPPSVITDSAAHANPVGRSNVAVHRHALPIEHADSNRIPVETSMRHAHLHDEALDELVLAAFSAGLASSFMHNQHFRRAIGLLGGSQGEDEIKERVLTRLSTRADAMTASVLQAAASLTVFITQLTVNRTTQFELLAADRESRQVLLDAMDDLGSMGSLHERVQRLGVPPSCAVHVCTDIFSQMDGVGVLHRVASSSEEGQGGMQRVPRSRCMLQMSVWLFAAIVSAVPRVAKAVDTCVCFVNAFGRIETDDFFSDYTGLLQGHEHDPITAILMVHHACVVKDFVERSTHEWPQGVGDIVNDEMLWIDVQLAKNLLRPIGLLFAMCSTGTTVEASMFSACWLAVFAASSTSTGLTRFARESVTQAVLHCFNWSGPHLALTGLLLDQRYRGEGLSTAGRHNIEATIHQAAPTAIEDQVPKYLAQDTLFDDASGYLELPSTRLLLTEIEPQAEGVVSVAHEVFGVRPHVHQWHRTWELLKGSAVREGLTWLRGARSPEESRWQRLASRFAYSEPQDDGRTRDIVRLALSLLARATLEDASLQPTTTSNAEERRTGDLDPPTSTSTMWATLRYIRTHALCSKVPNDPLSVDVSWFETPSIKLASKLCLYLHRALAERSAN